MTKKDKVRVTIGGRCFYLTSADDPKYLLGIAGKIDKEISALVRENVGLGFEQAAVLTALKYCDDLEKKLSERRERDRDEENLGKRLVQYSKELTRATARIKSLEKELARLKKEQEEK